MSAMQIDDIRNQLRDYDRRYRFGEPVISDTEYDKLLRKLQHLEQQSGKPVPPDSPTQRIGSDLVKGRKEVRHRVPMLSIENCYSAEELRNFGSRVQKILQSTGSGLLLPGEASSVQWVAELKIDGTSVALIYEHGLLTQGLTRGNGETGNDITHNVKTIRDIPLRLDTEHPPEMLEVRGEIYIRNSDFNEMKQCGILDKDAKNPRNVAAGTIGLDDPKVCAERKLRFFAHSAGSMNGGLQSGGIPVNSHYGFLHEIRQYGIPTAPHTKRFESFDQAAEYCESLYSGEENFLSELDFEIDGLVLKVDDFSLRKRIGSTGHHPRWVIAYKVEKYEAATVLREIRVQVGKQGTVTPVAELEPVEIDHTVIARATLHNAEEIERKDIRIGDTVIVEKAGKIIPHIVRVEKHLRSDDAVPFVFPAECPVCGSPLSREKGGVHIRCPSPQCPAQFKEKLKYFAGRNAMDIEGLGVQLIEQLTDSGLVKTFRDLYRLQERADDLLKMARLGKRSVEKLLAQIEKSRSRELRYFINALCIPGVGTGTARELAKYFGTLENLRTAAESELAAVDNIGEFTAGSIVSFFRNEKEMVDDLLTAMNRTEDKPPMKSKAIISEKANFAETAAGKDSSSLSLQVQRPLPLAGMMIGVTGTLKRFKRTEIEEVIIRFGGKPSSGVSSKTAFVLVGDDPGSKLEKAKKLGVRIVYEPEFLQMIGES
jgi:DNA ligase (NAD+)